MPILEGRSILSFALERWTDVWRSRHHIMSRLAGANTVLYSSPPFQIRDVIGGRQHGDQVATGFKQIRRNLYTYVPPRWLPKTYRFPTIDRMTTECRHRQIRSKMSDAGMKNPILYLWHPSFVDMIGAFDESLVVYHCYDEYRSFYMNEPRREALIRQEQHLLERADLVFAASEELCERRRPFNANTHLVRNAVDYELFASAQQSETKIPKDLAGIRPPVIGCVATQTAIMDLPLIAQVFRRRPDWSFVFIGIDRAPEQHAGNALRAVQDLPNVHFIGRRPTAEMPGYLKGCNVCTVPLILFDATMVCSSPLKMYEYMAAGKPIVSTPLPLLSHMGTIINFAKDANEWIAAIELALRQDDPEQIKSRQVLARVNTWDQRVDFISQKLSEKFAQNP